MKWVLTREYFDNNREIYYEYDVETDELVVPDHKMKYFKSYVIKINRILPKLNIPEIRILNQVRSVKPFEIISGGKKVNISVPVTEITFTYPDNMRPNNEWKLVAVINHDEKIVKHINKDIDIPEDLVDLNKSHCDRCNKSLRRHRTLIIFNKETNEYIRVGGSCIKFYLGLNYDKFLKVLDQLEELHSPGWIDGTDYEKPDYINHWDYYTFDIDNVLRVTLNWLDDHPYISRQNADSHSQATSTIIYNIIFNAAYGHHWYSFGGQTEEEIMDREESNKLIDKYNKDHELLDDVKEFAKNLDASKSSYNMNIVKMIESNEQITGAQFGLLVSIVPYYKKVMGIKKEQSKINNEYVGTIGEKYPFEYVKVLKIFWQDGDFGSYKKYIMEDKEGHRLVKNGQINKRYAVSDLVDGEVGEGTILQFNGEIRYHSEYKEIKNTTIGRISKYTK
jgi:hypothetical protein